MYLLDTDVVSELRNVRHGRADQRVVAWAILELEQGVLLVRRRDAASGVILRDGVDRQVRPAFADRIIAVDSTIAQRCARLHVPDPRSKRDARIAATALVHGLEVVTRDV
jgi:predicted nucleic acid-binding protein